MRKYRLKEEVRKYFTTALWRIEKNIDDWYVEGVQYDALEEVEEVEEKIEVDGSYLIHPNITQINIKGDYSEQIEDIEKFLNVFGSWEKMEKIAEDFADLYAEKEGFTSWNSYLKEKGYNN